MNTKILLNERPVGEPTLGNFRTVQEDIVSPKEGEVLLKTIYMSLDPYMRGRMNDTKSYAKPVGIGEHGDILTEIEKELKIVAEYDDQLQMIDKYFTKKDPFKS